MARIAVVGAGPSGCSAGYHLARSGHHVTLIDRAVFPRDKTCGDVVSFGAQQALSAMGLYPAQLEALCAQRARTVSALELELQAEVDKYVTCLLSGDPGPAASAAWRRRLYDACSFEPDLDADERDRYRVANDNARRYAGALERRYVARGRIADMLVALRRFYRLPIAGKLDAIARAA